MQNSSKSVLKIVVVGLMAAFVFVASRFSIPLVTIGDGMTRIHMGNIVCLLSGMLFGGVYGGLSAGIGSVFFDLFDPLYIASAPFTLVFKFLMGFICGTIAHSGLNRGNNSKLNIIGGIAGQLTYIILYLSKSFIESLLIGNAVNTSIFMVANKGIISSINAIVAIAVAVPLALVMRKALVRTNIFSILDKTSNKVRS